VTIWDIRMSEPATKKSDLPTRAVSAVVMLAVAAAAFALGNPWLAIFIALVALAAFVEFVLLVMKATRNYFYQVAAVIAGAFYMTGAAFGLARMPRALILVTVVLVILTDTCAYFAGRAIGGPKIAPKISPSKTWAGLAGGMTGAALWLVVVVAIVGYALSGLDGGARSVAEAISGRSVALALAIGGGLAIAAQAGDFFESWLKRRAGVKDSSRLIPGHGGVFDRVDGLLPVAIIAGLMWGWGG
jgi:phosphatidate cytidylyltransferase